MPTRNGALGDRGRGFASDRLRDVLVALALVPPVAACDEVGRPRSEPPPVAPETITNTATITAVNTVTATARRRP